ncbi:hypothetical protein BpHYR1_045319, partial [Brachionus plicatilis]
NNPLKVSIVSAHTSGKHILKANKLLLSTSDCLFASIDLDHS